MADLGIIGEIEEIKTTDIEKEIHWKIPKFLTLSVAYYYVCPGFKFLNTSWYLKLDPSEYKTEDNLAILLKTGEIESSCDVMCTFGIKAADGSMVAIKSFKHSLHAQVYNLDISLTVHKFFTRSELEQRCSELVPLGELKIMCNLKLLSDSVRLAELDTLSENMKGLFTNGEYCDTTLQLENREFTTQEFNREFKAHKIILAARSPVFAAMFKHETSEKQTGIVNIPDCDSDSFQEFLEFLYCGKVENISFRSALHLYKIADKYDVQELKKFCTVYMKHHLEVENVCDVIVLADEYDETNLLAVAQNFFSRNLTKIFETAGWKELFKNNFFLANKLLIQMVSKVKVVE